MFQKGEEERGVGEGATPETCGERYSDDHWQFSGDLPFLLPSITRSLSYINFASYNVR